MNTLTLRCWLLSLFAVINIPLTDGSHNGWTDTPSVVGVIGQNVTLSWTLDLSFHSYSGDWSHGLIFQRKDSSSAAKPMISLRSDGARSVFDAFASRDSDLTLKVSKIGSKVTLSFTINNLIETDGAQYTAQVGANFIAWTSEHYTTLTVNGPISITSPHPLTLTVNESASVELVCNATGSPTPNITWTKDGVKVDTGTKFTKSNLNYQDNNACYICSASNGVGDAKTANFCLNVQFKPRDADIQTNPTTICKNKAVNITCQSLSSNPPPSTYKFFQNGLLVQNNINNFYTTTNTLVLPDVNTFTCSASNLLGDGVNSTAKIVESKDPPKIDKGPQNIILSEGQDLILFCNASGHPAPNVTWSKVGGSIVGHGEILTIANVTSEASGSYACEVSNGQECDTVNSVATVTVKHKPIVTHLNTSSGGDRFCKGNSTTINCKATGDPQPVEYSLYRNDQLVEGRSISGVFDVQLDNKGNNTFRCVPNNTIGVGVGKSIYLFVNDPPNIDQLPQGVVLTEGQSLSLFCNGTGHPAPTVTWSKVGGGIVGSGETLNIASVTSKDAGSYQCVVSNGQECDSDTSPSALVTVKHKPEIQQLSNTPSGDQFCKGNTTTIICNATANPQPVEYSLYRNDQLVKSGSPTGVFTDVQLNQIGNNTFKCVANNSLGIGGEKKITLFVKDPPSGIVISPENVVLNEGQKLTLFCNGSGLPAPNVTWSKVGGGIVGYGVTFTIASVARGDEGSYRCELSNGKECDSVSAEASVTVNFEPSKTNFSDQSNKDRYCREENTIFSCNATAKPLPSYSLYRNGQLIESQSNGTFLVQLNIVGNLIFTCVPINIIGTGQNSSLNVVVEDKPTASIWPTGKNLKLQQSLTLFCNVSGLLAESITWFQIGKGIVGNGSSLTLDRSTQNVQGNYRCITNYRARCSGNSSDVSVDLDRCFQNLCKNNAVCVVSGTTYTCKCTRGLRGRYCETEDALHKKFSCVLIFVVPAWNPVYEDKNSVSFQNLAKKICDKMFEILPLLQSCTVIGFSPGSLKSELSLTLKETVTENELVTSIKNATSNGTILSEDLILTYPGAVSAKAIVTPCTLNPCKFDGVCSVIGTGYRCECSLFRYGDICEKGMSLTAGIIIIVLACLVIIFIIILLCHYYCTRDKHSGDADRGESFRRREYIYGDYHSRHTSFNEHAETSRAAYYKDVSVGHLEEEDDSDEWQYEEYDLSTSRITGEVEKRAIGVQAQEYERGEDVTDNASLYGKGGYTIVIKRPIQH